MKRTSVGAVAVLAALTIAGLASTYWPRPATAIPPQSAQLYFSPRGGCASAIVAAIDGAARSVHVQAYSFTSKPIAQALLRARDRGLEVEVILDDTAARESYSSATFFANQKVPVLTDGDHAIAHNKVIILDGAIVVTGSFNFTKQAEESNAENVLILNVPDLAAAYEANYQGHRAHAQPYRPQPPAAPRPGR